MKNIIKLFIAGLMLTGFITACSKIDNLHKEDPLPLYAKGKSPVLSSSVTTVAPTLADTSNTVISFNWTNPEYANDSSTTKYVVEIDTAGGSFLNPSSKTVNGILSTSFTGRELNAILLAYGYPLTDAKTVSVRVLSSYANNNERYASNTLTITVTPFADPSKFTGSVSEATLALTTAGDKAIDYSWTQAYPGFSGAVSYSLEYDSAGKGFVSPKQISLSAPTLLTTSLTQGQLNETALSVGVVGGTDGKVDYRVKATTAFGAVAYSNVFSVLIHSYFPIRRFYMPGGYQSSTGNGNDWDPPTAPEFIRDTRDGALNDIYYMYIYLPAGQEFKFTQGRSWDINYGGTGGNLSKNGSNLSVPESGVYRIVINASTLKYDIRKGRMGFVGGAVGAGWTPPNVFPNYEMGLAAPNLFVGLTDFSTGNEWKMIDNDSWNNGSLDLDNTRSYGSTAAGSGSMQINAGNFPAVSTAGRYRVIWDGRNRDDIQYQIIPAAQMRVVGDGIQGVNAWDPGASPQMNYNGNGIWTITLDLVGDKDIKFLAGDAWGAFDYEDGSNGDQSTGTARPIKWDGGPNFKTPAASGSYTITLNENLQTVTITN